jgi:heme oxygenase
MKATNELRARLREATAQIHERLHGHPGLGAAASGAIGRDDYRLLLARLWGFHKAFETVLDEAARRLCVDIDMADRARAPMLEADLATLGLDGPAMLQLPRCDQMFQPRSEAAFMGSLYVVEGSTLGGVHIARALSGLFPGTDHGGRTFFLGYGERHSLMWRGFLQRLDAFAGDATHEAEAIKGAVETFDDFEIWMNGWRTGISLGA